MDVGHEIKSLEAARGEVHTPENYITWNLKLTQLKRKIIFQTCIFGFHVNFQGYIVAVVTSELCRFSVNINPFASQIGIRFPQD